MTARLGALAVTSVLPPDLDLMPGEAGQVAQSLHLGSGQVLEVGEPPGERQDAGSAVGTTSTNSQLLLSPAGEVC